MEKSANLCWGQRYHWLRYQHVPAGARHDAHIVANCPLPEGISVADLRAAINHLVRRHEALRTVILADPAGWPQQRVQPPAPLPVRLVSTESDGTPAPAAVVAELTVADFDLTRDWPIRACVVTTGGRPRRLVVVLNHIAFDDWSLNTFRREFEAMLAAITARRRAVLPPVAHQPVDLARQESNRDAAANAAELAHWRREIERLPADVFASRRSTAAGPGTAFSASITSPGLLTASREIAARHGCWPSAVHLACYAILTAGYTGEASVPFSWLTSHREASQHMSVMTCMFSPTVVSVQLADDPPFSELLRRTADRVEQAQRHAYVPYDEIAELIAAESFRRGQPVRIASEVNFLSYAPRSCGARRDRFAWNTPPAAWAQAGSDSYLGIYEWRDGVTVALHAQSAVLPAEAVERFLRGHVRLIEAHRDPSVDLRVSEAARELGFAPPARRELVRVGSDAVCVEATRAALRSHPAVVDARVQVRTGELVARVRTRAPLTPAELRTHVLGTMYDRPAVRCPDRLELVDAGDGDVDTDAHADLDRPATAAGGRSPGPAEELLTEVVALVNELAAVDGSDSYTAAGGRALRVPRTLSALRERGWVGISPDQLASARPLRALAARLTRVG
ncbi:condensation domain-containing protein [Micromonospora sp. NBC_01740]|uniref:condensation domain-containing protein n=1 Tax=Micromonospora sp. NBC_01740 TaxID=2975986 RepID=UPI002E10425A|nr:condensation domain-containing protein [Micromonospora sp. NBC_01740]